MNESELAVAVDLVGCALLSHRVEEDGSISVLSDSYFDRNFSDLPSLKAWLDAVVSGRAPAETAAGRVRSGDAATAWLEADPSIVWFDDWDGGDWIPFRYRTAVPPCVPAGVDVDFLIPKISVFPAP